ncbi:MAG TPA: GLPGLI family protein [Flavobacteriaceae bacterium]|nr:GLPGLI family protein [Flavobacteriaceae bacterium]
MKTLTSLTLFLLLCFSVQGFAQENVEVYYEQNSSRDSGNNTASYFKLYASAYLSTYKDVFEKEGFNDTSEKVVLHENEEGVLVYNETKVRKNFTRNDFYIDLNNGHIKQVLTQKGVTKKINDIPNKIDWHITEESKEIGKYIAIKAEVTFRGRDFEAWFTPEIPISAGPWKLYGLPGLILEVTDKEKEYQWHAINIKYPAEFDSEILVVNPDEIDKELSLQEALKQHLENQAREDRLRQARASQQGYKIETMYSGRESWLERVYEWE